MTPAQGDVYFELGGVASVRWDDSTSTVVTEWEGWANPAEFSALLEAELHALRDHHGTRQLLDCRRQKGLRQADQEKADREWLPRALAAGLKRFAVVLPISGLAASNLQERLGKVPKGRVEVKFFTSIEEAKLWLVH